MHDIMRIHRSLDYGPLASLIGTWTGNESIDLAPEGTERNEYYETIIFSEAGYLSNAEDESLCAVHYILKVQRITHDKVIHQETGYWLWEQGTDKVIHSLTIPYGICVLAGGNVSQENKIEFYVSAELGIVTKSLVILKTILRQSAMANDTN